MSDTSLNRVIQYGTTAERVAFTPDPAVGSQVLYIWYDTDSVPDTYIWDGSNWVLINPGAAATALIYSVCNGRLTLTTGVPVTTSDVIGASTIYFTPYGGNQIGLYTGANWTVETFSELSLALSGLTSDRNYDVFVDYNGGTPQLVLVIWTDATTRATALALQDGVLVLTGALDHRYIGTIRTTGTTTTEDSLVKRFTWNMYNRRSRSMVAIDGTDTWNYTLAAYRQANANAANQLAYVVGLLEDQVEAHVHAIFNQTNSAVNVVSGIGIDSSTVSSAILKGRNSNGTNVTITLAEYKGYPGLGYHEMRWLEYAQATGTATWFGDAGGATLFQSGIIGTMWG